MPALVLASTSVYRQQLLARLGVPFTTLAPTCDEEALKEPGVPPKEIAANLARAKAHSIAAGQREAHVLGSDQVVEIASEVLGKPGTSERALEQLTRLAGKPHRLITAFALVCPDGSLIEHVDVHTLHMRRLTRAELERYIAADKPLDCAGSYKIEARGIALFERVEGTDSSAITGLPLIALTTALRTRGFVVP